MRQQVDGREGLARIGEVIRNELQPIAGRIDDNHRVKLIVGQGPGADQLFEIRQLAVDKDQFPVFVGGRFGQADLRDDLRSWKRIPLVEFGLLNGFRPKVSRG